MARTSALAVANFLLDRGAKEQIAIRHLKLQKLIYFCYAWFAGNTGEELFSEGIEAWPLGPVIRDVYLEFKDCGSDPIHRRATTWNWDTYDTIEPMVDKTLADELSSVWDAYKHKSDAWLVSATHAPTEPWAILVKTVGRADKRLIPFDLIRKIYSSRVEAIEA